jgi:CheY-like chemotaxis protein
VLESAGYTVIEATQGDEALKEAIDGDVDLVIMDLVMPEREGIETIRELRRGVPRVGIIAISGAFEGNLLRPAKLLGADAALSKPLTRELLLTSVDRVLKARRF